MASPPALRRRHGLLLRSFAAFAVAGLATLLLGGPAAWGLGLLGVALVAATAAGRTRGAHRAAVQARRRRA